MCRCGIENDKLKHCSHKDVGMIFTVVNVELENDEETAEANNDKSLMRFEFIHFLARCVL